MRDFLTVPDELLVSAEKAADHFEGFGYQVTIEKQSLEYPYTPTLVCKRQSMTMLVEVASSVPKDRIVAWAAYGRSCASDTRVVLCIPVGSSLSVGDHAELRQLGVGLYE